MAERAKTLRMVVASSSVGTTFSRLAITMCTRGSAWVKSPLPSLVTMIEEPVSATRKLAPVTPTSAARKRSRRIPRASSTSSRGSSSERSGGRWLCWARKSASIKSLVRCTAGAMMWLGRSPRSWMMYSPRSVSTGVMPFASRCAFRSISSEIMDLPLVTVLAPTRRQMSRIAARASAALGHQWTWPPWAVTRSS